MFESIIVLVVIGVAAAFLACRAKKTLSGEDGCGCGKEKSCAVKSLDSLSAADAPEQEDEDDDAGA
ncbi:MAG: hypothetical protein QGH60_13230 [Phycisphaerae bacterium]|nr:hypothetical protein [Phycisphaerae bacterium]